MALPFPPLALLPEGPFSNPDWVGIGLVLAIVGSFLLANSILFRHPRELVAERFGRPGGRLRTIREYIFHRVQVNLGFGFLLAGFVLQLYGRYRPPETVVETGLSIVWIGLVVALAAALLVGGWWWSLLAFRRYVIELLAAGARDFETDLDLAREIGELFGVAPHSEDTVQSFLARLRQRIGRDLPARGAGKGVLPPEPDEAELEEGVA